MTSSKPNYKIYDPLEKKMIMKGEELIIVPVAADDFKKMNEMAEALMIVRHPEKS